MQSIHRPHLGLLPSRQRRAVNSNLWISCGKLWITSFLCGELAQLFQKSRETVQKEPPIFGGSFLPNPRYGSVDKSLILWIICPVSSTGFPPQGQWGSKTESAQGVGASERIGLYLGVAPLVSTLSTGPTTDSKSLYPTNILLEYRMGFLYNLLESPNSNSLGGSLWI